MRHYNLFLIKQEVAKDYYGKEPLLGRLFSEMFQSSIEEEREQLEKQVHYITEPLSLFRMETLLKRALKDQVGVQFTSNDHEMTIESIGEESQAQLLVSNRNLCLKCSGSLLTETLVFEICRSIEPYFFAVDRKKGGCGWLRPIKTSLIPQPLSMSENL